MNPFVAITQSLPAANRKCTTGHIQHQHLATINGKGEEREKDPNKFPIHCHGVNMFCTAIPTLFPTPKVLFTEQIKTHMYNYSEMFFLAMVINIVAAS